MRLWGLAPVIMSKWPVPEPMRLALDAARKAAEAAKAEEERKQAAAAPAPAPRPAGPSDAALWAEVERLGSEQAVRRYLSAYPGGARSTQARQMLQVIERMRRGG